MTGIARSQALMTYTSSQANDSRAFTCPTGHVTLVKSLAVVNQGAAAGHVYAYALHTGMAQPAYLLSVDVALGQIVTWAGFIALNPTDVIAVLCSIANMSVWVSGAVLSGPNQFPPVTQASAQFAYVSYLPA